MIENLLFIDTETTGFESDARIVSITSYFENVATMGTYSGIFKPPVPIGLRAMAVHHITEKMVADKPPFIGSKHHDFITDCLADDFVVVAHNAPFDLKMLAREGIEVERYIDTCKLAKALGNPECESHQLQYLRYFYDLDVEAIAHSAEGDVAVLIALFKRLWQLHDEPTIEEMIEISR